MNISANTCKYKGRTFRQTIWNQILSKNRQKFAKSSNQNICSPALSQFVRFPEPGDKFANMATQVMPYRYDRIA